MRNEHLKKAPQCLIKEDRPPKLCFSGIDPLGKASVHYYLMMVKRKQIKKKAILNA